MGYNPVDVDLYMLALGNLFLLFLQQNLKLSVKITVSYCKTVELHENVETGHQKNLLSLY